MPFVRRARATVLLPLLVTFLVGGCTGSPPQRSAQPPGTAPELPVVSEAPAATPAPPAPVPDDVSIDFPLEHPVVSGVRTAAGTMLAAADGGVFALSHAA